MEKEEILQLFASLKDELLSAVDQKNSGTAASIKREVNKLLETVAKNETAAEEGEADTSSDSPKLSMKALQQEIKKLQEEREEEKKQAQKDRRTAAIANVISSTQLTNPSAAQKLFTLNYADRLKEENNQWFLEEGDSVIPLQDLFKQYLSTEEGGYFIPPSSVNGSGSKETKTNPPSTSTDKSVPSLGHSLATALINSEI